VCVCVCMCMYICKVIDRLNIQVMIANATPFTPPILRIAENLFITNAIAEAPPPGREGIFQTSHGSAKTEIFKFT